MTVPGVYLAIISFSPSPHYLVIKLYKFLSSLFPIATYILLLTLGFAFLIARIPTHIALSGMFFVHTLSENLCNKK
jgi:hypothetical protein